MDYFCWHHWHHSSHPEARDKNFLLRQIIAANPEWVLPDRNTIPHDVPFFQRLRYLMADICHRRGALAIGGMTALYPSREDPELNARALAVLEQDKKNEARYKFYRWNCGRDQRLEQLWGKKEQS